jgi:serine/threonine protein phosphatase 1
MTLRKMALDVLRLTPRDTLYLLGDYIDRGPDSKGVLDFILELQHRGHSIIAIRGNHEQMLLDAALGTARDDLWLECFGEDTLKQFGSNQSGLLPTAYLELLSAMPLLHDTGDHILVHSGPDFLNAAALPENGSTIICGHTMTPLQTIYASLQNRSRTICLDNGCWAAGRKADFGNLVALDLDSHQLSVLKNCEQA